MTAFRAFDTPLRSYSGRTVIHMQSKTAKLIAVFYVYGLHVYRAGLDRALPDTTKAASCWAKPGFDTDVHGLVTREVDGKRGYLVDCVRQE